VAALGALTDARAIAPLIERLGDDAPEVRAAAAEALAARKEMRAVPRLVRLVRRGDMGAAAPAGRLATPEAVADLCGMQGAAAEGALAVALGTYVKRADISDGTRIEPLRTIAKLHGVEATAALADYLASIPPRDTRPSKREAERLLDERGPIGDGADSNRSGGGRAVGGAAGRRRPRLRDAGPAWRRRRGRGGSGACAPASRARRRGPGQRHGSPEWRISSIAARPVPASVPMTWAGPR